MTDEMPAVLRVENTIYGASAGNVFPSVAYAEEVVQENPAVFTGRTVTAVPVQPHGLAVVDGETHDSAGRTGIPGDRARDGVSAGSPDGTLRDPERKSLLAVLTDGTTVYGASEGADQARVSASSPRPRRRSPRTRPQRTSRPSRSSRSTSCSPSQLERPEPPRR